MKTGELQSDFQVVKHREIVDLNSPSGKIRRPLTLSYQNEGHIIVEIGDFPVTVG